MLIVNVLNVSINALYSMLQKENVDEDILVLGKCIMIMLQMAMYIYKYMYLYIILIYTIYLYLYCNRQC